MPMGNRLLLVCMVIYKDVKMYSMMMWCGGGGEGIGGEGEGKRFGDNNTFITDESAHEYGEFEWFCTFLGLMCVFLSPTKCFVFSSAPFLFIDDRYPSHI